MKKDQSFHDHIMQDVLSGVDGVSSRAMFGGWGIYKDGVFFALIADGEVYFKVDDVTRVDFEKQGGHPFTYSHKEKGHVTMGYWSLPEEVMENKRELGQWIDKAVQVAKNKKK